MTQFKNLQDVINYFSSEDKCRDTLEKMRFPDGRIACPKCGVRGAWRNADMKTFRCKSKTCNHKFSITVGTVMEGSKLPLSKWFTAIYISSAHKKGISSCQLARDLGVTQKTAWFLNHRIREMFGNSEELQATNIVEMDETYVGGKWQNMTRSKRKQYSAKGIDTKIPVMGIVQRDGRVTLKVIGKTDVLKDFVYRYVKPDAVVVTDGHIGYRGIDETHKGHIIINHANDEYVNGIYHTNTVEGFFSMLKRGIYGIYHHVSPKHLHRYCEEFSYRYNSRKIKDNSRFVLTLQQSKGRLKYYELIGKPKPDKKSAA